MGNIKIEVLEGEEAENWYLKYFNSYYFYDKTNKVDGVIVKHKNLKRKLNV